jgi:hypothetical protein
MHITPVDWRAGAEFVKGAGLSPVAAFQHKGIAIFNLIYACLFTNDR